VVLALIAVSFIAAAVFGHGRSIQNAWGVLPFATALAAERANARRPLVWAAAATNALLALFYVLFSAALALGWGSGSPPLAAVLTLAIAIPCAFNASLFWRRLRTNGDEPWQDTVAMSSGASPHSAAHSGDLSPAWTVAKVIAAAILLLGGAGLLYVATQVRQLSMLAGGPAVFCLLMGLIVALTRKHAVLLIAFVLTGILLGLGWLALVFLNAAMYAR